ncbi:hypothetical protein M441DRAFT_111557, partial [Trichoderma asperellum CBS 433.97]
NGEIRSIEFPASIANIVLARVKQLWFKRHVAFDRRLLLFLPVLARLNVLMSANYGRRLFTWGHCLFFLYYGLLLHGVCAFFFTFLCLYIKSQLKEPFFSFYGAGLRPFWCVSIRSGALFTEPSCTIKRRKKNK